MKDKAKRRHDDDFNSEVRDPPTLKRDKFQIYPNLAFRLLPNRLQNSFDRLRQ